MSDEPRHRSHRRRPVLQVEPLEGRALLSIARPPIARLQTILVVHTSGESINQQEGAFTVTVSLKKGIVNGSTGAQPDASLDVPLTVDFSASLEPPGIGNTEVASPIFAPVHQTVTFPPGASSETVTVPMISSADTPDPVLIHLLATATSPSLGIPSGDGMVDLYSSPDAIPPTITSVRPVTHGKLASGVVLGFSKPMAPATAEDIHNYRVLSRPESNTHKGFLFWGGATTKEIRSFPIAAATYDPATWSVKLTLKQPAWAASLYEIASAYPLEGHMLTDTEGQPLAQSPFVYPIQSGGNFTILVHSSPGVIPPLVGGLRTTYGTPSPFSRLNPLSGFA
jgi:hypothetical protein